MKINIDKIINSFKWWRDGVGIYRGKINIFYNYEALYDENWRSCILLIDNDFFCYLKNDDVKTTIKLDIGKDDKEFIIEKIEQQITERENKLKLWFEKEFGMNGSEEDDKI